MTSRQTTQANRRSKGKAKAAIFQGAVMHHGKWINPQLFLDRELSWLEFNRRVLQQAIDKRTPLLERIKFCEIYRSNLDEYCMKRLGTLYNKKVLGNVGEPHENASDKYQQVRAKIAELNQQLKQSFEQDIKKKLKAEKINLVSFEQLSSDEKKYLKSYFNHNIYPVLTPLTVDQGHPFPFISNLSRSLAISFKRPQHKGLCFARVKIPENIPQWISTQEQRTLPIRLIHLSELVSHNIERLFKGMDICQVMLFRITRNAHHDAHEQFSEDVMEIVEEGLRERKFAPVMRLEHGPNPDPWLLDFISTQLDITPDQHFPLASIANLTSFREITSLPAKHLKYTSFKAMPPRELTPVSPESPSIFDIIRHQDLMVHHPYESFQHSVQEFVRQAGLDEKVMAIKMTFYRTDSAGQFIDSLIQAAENGKQVVVVIELKARFDEEKNIHWAQKLEDVGIHVTYGLHKKKTHSKLAMAIRKDPDRIRTYAHIGTGNYNPQTSHVYEDLGLFTCQEAICSDVIEVFNHLTGQSLTENYQALLVAPFNMKNRFLQLMDQEIAHAKKGLPARIIGKMNQLEDIDIIEKLYQASRAGVRVELIVRGFCCLRPGVKKYSANIRVISVIGKYLEHSRIYHFANGKEKREEGLFYQGSADWMHRNFHHRVEVIAPVYEQKHRRRLSNILDILLNDPRQAWELDQEGHYTQRNPHTTMVGSHSQLEDFYRSKNGGGGQESYRT